MKGGIKIAVVCSEFTAAVWSDFAHSVSGGMGHETQLVCGPASSALPETKPEAAASGVGTAGGGPVAPAGAAGATGVPGMVTAGVTGVDGTAEGAADGAAAAAAAAGAGSGAAGLGAALQKGR
jgi:hypothetical protein